jgi:hypothetical protein
MKDKYHCICVKMLLSVSAPKIPHSTVKATSDDGSLTGQFPSTSKFDNSSYIFLSAQSLNSRAGIYVSI